MCGDGRGAGSGACHGLRCRAHVIAPGCPVDCLRAVVSAAAFNRLARAEGAPFPPVTVGDVIALYQQGRLGDIGGLGRRRIGEIEMSLLFAGLSQARREQR